MLIAWAYPQTSPKSFSYAQPIISTLSLHLYWTKWKSWKYQATSPRKKRWLCQRYLGPRCFSSVRFGSGGCGIWGWGNGYAPPQPVFIDPATFRRDYSSRLDQLQFNPRPTVQSLSFYAQEYSRYADVVAEYLDGHIRKVSILSVR